MCVVNFPDHQQAKKYSNQSAVRLQTEKMKIVKLWQRAVKYFENQEVYEELVAKFLLFVIETLSPIKVRDGKKKISTLFLMNLLNPIVCMIIELIYLINEYQNIDLPKSTENIAILLCMLRVFIILTYVILAKDNLADLVHRFIDERKSKQSEDARQITINHSKQEFIGTTIFIVFPWFAIICLCLSPIFREYNATNTPGSAFPQLTLENKFLQWMVNYVYQTIMSLLVAVPATTLFPLTFLLMNHSCWHIDQTILLLKNLGDGDNCSEMIKSAVKESYGVIRWINDAQQRLQFIFFVEFTIMGIMLCMNFVSVLIEPPGTFVVFVMISVQLTQFYIFCWLGERVLNRIDNLSAAIYDVKWYQMRVSDRKSIQLMLVMSQNLRGFNGIFNEVKMETFMKIVQFAYSLVMFFASV